MASQPERWLTTDEQRAWRAFLDATRLLFDSLDEVLQRTHGMSHADYELLARLSEAEGRRMRMSALADKAFVSRSRLSHAVARLEALGWVERRTHPLDGRGTLAVLTDRGMHVLRSAAPVHVDSVRERLFDPLDERQTKQLEAIADAIQAGLRRCGGGRHCR